MTPLMDNRTLSTSPPASDYDENDSYDHSYYVASENDGLYNIYTAETRAPCAVGQERARQGSEEGKGTSTSTSTRECI